MNKYLWLVIVVFILSASYGMYRVLFYNPTDTITKAKLELGRPPPDKEPEPLSAKAGPDLSLPPEQPGQPPLPGPRLDALPGLQPAPEQPPLPQNTLANQASLVGKWQNNSDARYSLEFKSNNTVQEYTDAALTGEGTWEFGSDSTPAAGPQVQTLKVTIGGASRTYQILNLSATNLSYVTSNQEGIQSYKRTQ